MPIARLPQCLPKWRYIRAPEIVSGIPLPPEELPVDSQTRKVGEGDVFGAAISRRSLGQASALGGGGRVGAAPLRLLYTPGSCGRRYPLDQRQSPYSTVRYMPSGRREGATSPDESPVWW